MLRLISGPLSLFTGKVRIALDEKGITYMRDDVPFTRARGYDPKPAEVLARNPKAQVPILVDDDFSLYDSTLIFEYLEERFPDPPLYPKELRARARCRQLEAAADEILFPHVWVLIRALFYGANESPETVDAARQGFAEHLAQLDRHLAERRHLCGDAFTVADIGYWMTVEFARRLGLVADPALAHVARWWQQVSTRPAVAREHERLEAAVARILA